MKIQLFTVIVPNGIPEVRIYTRPEDADAWIAENASHYDNKPRYAPAAIDAPLSWLEAQAAKARSKFDAEIDDLATMVRTMPPALGGDAQAEAEHNAAVERIYERSPDAQANIVNMIEDVPNAI